MAFYRPRTELEKCLCRSASPGQRIMCISETTVTHHRRLAVPAFVSARVLLKNHVYSPPPSRAILLHSRPSRANPIECSKALFTEPRVRTNRCAARVRDVVGARRQIFTRSRIFRSQERTWPGTRARDRWRKHSRTTVCA